MTTANQTLPAMPAVEGVEHEYVEVAGGRMHVASRGTGDPILLLSGFGQSWWEWRDIMPALSDAGYRAIAPDLRGEGWTRLPFRQIDRTRRAEDILELLDLLGLGKVRVVSHDMGSVSAFQLAFAHPERIASHVMISVPPPQMRFHVGMVPGMRHLWHQEALSVPGVGSWLMRSGRVPRHFFSPVFFPRPLDPAVLDQYLALMQYEDSARAAVPLCRRMVLPELARIVGGRYRAARFAMPTLFIFGTEDSGFPPSVTGKAFADTTLYGPDVRLGMIEEAGHFAVDEQPAAVADAVLAFFASLESETADDRDE